MSERGDWSALPAIGLILKDMLLPHRVIRILEAASELRADEDDGVRHAITRENYRDSRSTDERLTLMPTES